MVGSLSSYLCDLRYIVIEALNFYGNKRLAVLMVLVHFKYIML